MCGSGGLILPASELRSREADCSKRPRARGRALRASKSAFCILAPSHPRVDDGEAGEHDGALRVVRRESEEQTTKRRESGTEILG